MTIPADANAGDRSDPSWFLEGLASCPVMAVFRGLSPADTVKLATAAWDIGVTQVEVPIESEQAIPSLVAAVDAGRERGMKVGAGTIILAEQLRGAMDAGAEYVVSPGFDTNLIALADRAGIPILPGIATASEILRARSMGFGWLKAFPAAQLGSDWFAAMKGPFPTINLVGTGGLNGDNADEFLKAGASVVGIGSAFGDARQRDELARIVAEA